MFRGTSNYVYKTYPPRGLPVKKSLEFNEKCESQTLSPLAVLRQLMRDNKVHIYYLTMQDEHNSEYVSKHDKRIEFISKFTGSAGTVIITDTYAELATDSRYHLMAERELSSEWQVRKLGNPGVITAEDKLIELAKENKQNVGLDARFVSNEVASKLQRELESHGLQLVDVPNLVDYVWGSNQPSLPSTGIFEHSLEYTGETASSKLDKVCSEMDRKGAKWLLVYALDEIAWLLNLRGGDIPYVPVFKSFLLVSNDNKLTLFIDKTKFPTNFEVPGYELNLVEYSEFFKHLRNLNCSSIRSWFSPNPKGPAIWIPKGCSWAISKSMKPSYSIIDDFSIVNTYRTVKNATEIENMKRVQLQCSVSIVQYLSWLNGRTSENVSEYDGSLKIDQIRQRWPDYRGESYECISAVGKNAALPHYAPPKSQSDLISKNQIYLLDSGGQYLGGSTDITRTMHFGTPTDEERRCYTLVLKGHLAVLNAKFPKGRGSESLDCLARQFLWQNGLDYGHGTGHGIGSFLSIHELPLGISATPNTNSTLVPHSMVTIEPGYYSPDKFGIRIENDALVVVKMTNNNTDYLGFENMTFVPYDRNLIDKNLLSESEVSAINEYHKLCRTKTLDLITKDYEREWLIKYTNEI